MAADLDVALLEHVEQADLDPLGEVGELVDGEDPAVGAGHEPVVDRELVGEVAAFGHLDRVDLADQVGDRGVRRGELLAVAFAAVHPGDRACLRRPRRRGRGRTRDTGWYGSSLISDPATIGSHSSSRSTSERMMRALGLTALAEEDHVVAGDERVLERGQDAVLDSRGPRRRPVRPRKRCTSTLRRISSLTGTERQPEARSSPSVEASVRRAETAAGRQARRAPPGGRTALSRVERFGHEARLRPRTRTVSRRRWKDGRQLHEPPWSPLAGTCGRTEATPTEAPD